MWKYNKLILKGLVIGYISRNKDGTYYAQFQPPEYVSIGLDGFSHKKIAKKWINNWYDAYSGKITIANIYNYDYNGIIK